MRKADYRFGRLSVLGAGGWLASADGDTGPFVAAGFTPELLSSPLQPTGLLGLCRDRLFDLKRRILVDRRVVEAAAEAAKKGE